MMTQTGATKPKSYNGDYMQAGKRGEEIVLNWLRKQPQHMNVVDVSSIQQCQVADVDCLIQLCTGKVEFAEIKSDRHMGVTTNVLFEFSRINHTCHPDHAVGLGWSARTAAQHLFIYASSLHKIYHCRTGQFRHVVQQYTATARQQTRIDWVNTDSGKSTLNFLIPWEACQSVFRIYDPEDEIGT